jgi:hypothetical protein
LTVPVRSNLLVANLPVPSHDYLPTGIEWRDHGRQERLQLAVNDMDVTCRAP